MSDADPRVPKNVAWKDAIPETENGDFKPSDRTSKLMSTFAGHPTVKVFPSKLTLEYDLAEAGDENAAVMAEVWESCFVGTPGTFNKALVDAAGNNRNDKALAAWRGICRAEHSGSKAEFAHLLAAEIEDKSDLNFETPKYLKDAIKYVVEKIGLPVQSDGESN